MNTNAQDAPTSTTLPRDHEQPESRDQAWLSHLPTPRPEASSQGRLVMLRESGSTEPGEGAPSRASLPVCADHPPLPWDPSPRRALPGGPWPQQVALRHLLMEEPCEQVTPPSQHHHQSKSGATYITWAPSLQFHVLLLLSRFSHVRLCATP